MKPKDFEKAREILPRALELTGSARRIFLERVCAGDVELRREIDELLSISESNDHLETPFLGPEFTIDSIWSLSRETPPEPPTIPEKVGSYKIVSLLAQGGHGNVYLALQEKPSRKVALKMVLASRITLDHLHRFDREARLLGRLKHAGIAQIYEAGTENTSQGPIHFFAMEFVEGQSLTDHANRHQLGTADRIRLLNQVADAVHYAHQQGVIHRDLKPSNILVEETGSPKILDFGVATAQKGSIEGETDVTLEGQLLGTLPYMSPEQVEGDPKKIDVRSDVYALGVIGYELLTGLLPHSLEDRPLPEQLLTIREDEATPLGKLDREFRGELSHIFTKVLEKDKGRRYESAAHFRSDLDRFLRGEPIRARPQTLAYRFGRLARRNPLLVFAFSAAVVGLILGFLGIGTAWIQANQQRDRARRLIRGNVRDTVANIDRDDVPLDLSRRFLERAIRELRVLIGQSRDRDANQILAEALCALGDLEEEARSFDIARRAHEEAFSLREELLREDPDIPQAMRDLSLSWVNRGDLALKIERDLQRAIECYGEALRIDEALVREHPDDLHYLDNLTWSYGRLARVSLQAGDKELAYDLLKKRRDRSEELLQRDLNRSLSHHTVAKSALSLAEIHLERSEFNLAHPLHLRALEQARIAVEMDPRNTVLAAQFLDSGLKTASTALELGQSDLAKTILHELKPFALDRLHHATFRSAVLAFLDYKFIQMAKLWTKIGDPGETESARDLAREARRRRGEFEAKSSQN